MGFPESVLTKDEHVEVHLHPHWKALVRPVFFLVVVVAAIVAAGVFLAGKGTTQNIGFLVVIGVGLVVFGWLTVWPWLTWRTTHYVFTNERVIMREGVFSREGRDIPLNRINDVSFQHSFFERLLGAGTLTIESAGERGQVVLNDIPRVEKIQSQLYELVESDHDAHTFDNSDRDAITETVARARSKDDDN
ncbi:MAG: hypothetical protein V7603_2048 [Micromonosporaceae bacterium]